MIHGLDTGFLVAAEITEHAEHAAARGTLAEVVSAGDAIAMAQQVLAEFVHIVTDPRRFAKPIDIVAARQLAGQWWTAREVVRVFSDEGAAQLFLGWLEEFSLGRKRLLDTLLAATYHQAGIRSMLTINEADFQCSPSSTASRLVGRSRIPDPETTPPPGTLFRREHSRVVPMVNTLTVSGSFGGSTE